MPKQPTPLDCVTGRYSVLIADTFHKLTMDNPKFPKICSGPCPVTSTEKVLVNSQTGACDPMSLFSLSSPGTPHQTVAILPSI